MHSLFNTALVAAGAILLVGGSFTAGAATVALLQDADLPHARGMALAPGALEAKAAVVLDLREGRVLYQKNANLELPLASLTKLMAAQAVLAARTPESVVEITAESLRAEGDSGLKPGEAYQLRDLLRLGLVASSNDAIAAAAASLGTDYLTAMNATAQRLGLTRTRFLNPTGLDVDEKVSGAYGSAYDVARLAAAFFKEHPALFEETMHHEVSVPQGARSLTAAATAAPLLDVPGLIGGKTGYTDLAGGNLVVAFDVEVGRPAVAVVLGSSREGRFNDMRALIAAARAAK